MLRVASMAIISDGSRLFLHRGDEMRSASLRRWLSSRRVELDRIAAAYGAVRGAGPGGRRATRQINQAYAVLLSAQFQGFCRDLHSECADLILESVEPPILRAAVRTEFSLARKLDRGNPNPGNIGADFDRLGLVFWEHVHRMDVRNRQRQRMLAELSEWRNAVAHQDFDRARLVPPSLTLQSIRRWRSACGGLARSFDRVIRNYVACIAGSASGELRNGHTTQASPREAPEVQSR